jgi:type III pantothenate kinase
MHSGILMNLIVDIGNTHIKLGWFNQGKLMESLRLDKNIPVDLTGWIKKKPVSMAIVSSVMASNKDFFMNAGLKLKKLIILDYTTSLPVKISYQSPETLGNDRIAAIAGARFVLPGCNVLIIDMGTAITIDFINAAGEYSGGNISPGMHTRFKSLYDYTARLPLVYKDECFPKFGYNTHSAIAAGVQQGIIYEINGYIDKFSRKYPSCKFIITGGDAEFFVGKLKRTIFAMPDLVMTGLNFILEFNAPDQNLLNNG